MYTRKTKFMFIEKLKKSGLKGRSGSGFPTGAKWEAVLNAKMANGNKKCYVICNAAEGEPAVFKDKYILERWPEEVVNGIKIAVDTFKPEKAYIYLHRPYYDKFKNKLKKIIGRAPIVLIPERGGYLCGEETTLIESIEGHRFEPRSRPPFPTEHGFFGAPTLVNNLETFYWISKIFKGKYNRSRFYSVSGDADNPGVFEFPENWNIGQILQGSNNVPKFDYFVQVGGGASGSFFTRAELGEPMGNSSSIVIYDRRKTNTKDLMKKIVNFFYRENCGKCAPCREGIYRLRELLSAKELNIILTREVLECLQETSFCPLGKGAAWSVGSLLEKIGLSS